jgi:arsenate reductase
MSRKVRILFLCTGNSCRSQMAEGWARALRAQDVEAYSAGVERHGMNPRAVRAMAEAGVDISGQSSQLVEDLPVQEFDWVVTLCDHAHETCPLYLGRANRTHRPFPDPPRLARDAASEEEAMQPYREVRDQIRTFVEGLPDGLQG